MPRDLNEIRNARVHEQQDKMSDDNETEQQAPMMATDTTESPAQHTENIQDDSNDSTIKPYVQSLTMLDLESCVKLEEATFPPEERCTREKVSPELLCMHISCFCVVVQHSHMSSSSTVSTINRVTCDHAYVIRIVI